MRRGIAAIAAFTALPFVTLIAANPEYPLPLSRLFVYWLAITLVLSMVVLGVGSKDKGLAERVAVVLALSIYVAGQLAVAAKNALNLEPVFGVDGAMWLMTALVLAAILISGWKWIQTYVPVLAVLLLLVPVAQIVTTRVAGGVSTVSVAQDTAAWDLTPTVTPSIYWFVLDGYGRADVITDTYGFSEQSRFLMNLVDRGFSISDEALAPYPLTFLSMASTISADYIAREGDSISNREPFFRRIQGDNPVVATLRSWGYTYVQVPGDQWSGSECAGWEDICVSPASTITESEWAVLSMTPFASLVTAAEFHARRSDPFAVVRAIEVSQPTEPMFAMIHLINPHPPYYQTGEKCLLQDVFFDLRLPFDDEYVEALKCLNVQLLEAIDRILARDNEAIIIMQGDHGPVRGLSVFDADLSEWTLEQMVSRFGVLNAMRLPSGCQPPTDMNLVNTFRVVFDCISVEEVSLLPTRTWLANAYPGDISEIDPPG